MMRIILTLTILAALAAPSIAMAGVPVCASAALNAAIASISDQWHEVAGSTMRCFRVGRGRRECPFVVTIIYRADGQPEATQTCLGSIVLRKRHAPRFRNGLSCLR